jgi:antitoxin component YwqK of YwqJK toxin-antitoxin module
MPQALAALGILFGAMAWLRVQRPVEEARMQDLELREGILLRRQDGRPFNGRVVSRDPDGSSRSASMVVGGRLHGLSEGWHTNGSIQVRESFVAGRSEGVRTKWRSDGSRESEAGIRGGRLHGRFMRWDGEGRPTEEAWFLDGVPAGEARQWHPDGSLKSWCRLEEGKVVESKKWSPGEKPDEMTSLARTR